jgi:tetratricopeptide (TPR) repeat protein
VPSDPVVLARMGMVSCGARFDSSSESAAASLLKTNNLPLARIQIYNKEDDEAQAFHFHLESYRHYPVSLDVISWLGVWYVKSELYEKAIHFFERASQIQPDEVTYTNALFFLFLFFSCWEVISLAA